MCSHNMYLLFCVFPFVELLFLVYSALLSILKSWLWPALLEHLMTSTWQPRPLLPSHTLRSVHTSPNCSTGKWLEITLVSKGSDIIHTQQPTGNPFNLGKPALLAMHMLILQLQLSVSMSQCPNLCTWQSSLLSSDSSNQVSLGCVLPSK